MESFRKKWFWVAGLLLAIGIFWWQFGPRSYDLVYRGHKFEYLEPLSSSTNRSALLRIWLGYEGRRPGWWGQKVESKIEDGHEWSFSNGVNVKGGGGFPAIAEYNADKDCYQYDLEKGLTAYRVENGQMVTVASGLATQCRLSVKFQDPHSGIVRQIPMTLELNEGQEIFNKN